jgi:hypothetical protein
VEEARAALPRVRELLLVLQRAATLAAKVRSNGHAKLHASEAETETGPESEPPIEEREENDPEDPGGASAGLGQSGALGAADALGAGGIQPILEGLEELGIVLRDPARGLIDFPATHLGRQVQLCWQLGEDDLGWWHFPDEGFAGRHPLPLPDSW